MIDLPVPFRPRFIDLEPANLDFHKAEFKNNRDSLLSELRCVPAVLKATRALDPKTLYTIKVVPEGAAMYRDAAGNYKGVFYKNGRIVQHAKLKAVRPALFGVAATVGSQVLLVSIAMQLSRIENAIERIGRGLHDGNIADIESGLSQFEQAMVMQDYENRRHVLLHAIQSLNSGVARTIRFLGTQIAEAPDPANTFWDNWGKSKAKKAKERMQLAEESYRYSLLGIRALCECYACMNEPVAAATTLADLFGRVENAGIHEAARKARLIPVEGKELPEHSWQAFLDHKPRVMEYLKTCQACDPASLQSISVEFKPLELGGR